MFLKAKEGDCLVTNAHVKEETAEFPRIIEGVFERFYEQFGDASLQPIYERSRPSGRPEKVAVLHRLAGQYPGTIILTYAQKKLLDRKDGSCVVNEEAEMLTVFASDSAQGRAPASRPIMDFFLGFDPARPDPLVAHPRYSKEAYGAQAPYWSFIDMLHAGILDGIEALHD